VTATNKKAATEAAPAKPKLKATALLPASDPKSRTAARARKKAAQTSWKDRLTLRFVMVFTMVLSIVTAGGVIGYYSIRIVYESKVVDAWAILFLELEKRSNELSEKLERFVMADGSGEMGASPFERQIRQFPDMMYFIDAAGGLVRVSGKGPAKIPTKELGLTTASLTDAYSLLQLAGENFIAIQMSSVRLAETIHDKITPGTYVLMWKIDTSPWTSTLDKYSDRMTVYLTSKQGKLIYANKDAVNGTNFQKRALVQRFVADPFRQGQIAFKNEDGASYGFYSEVPKSNLVMFVEVSRKVALAVVTESILGMVWVLFGVLGIAAVILQSVVGRMTAPIRDLVSLTRDIGQGRFTSVPIRMGFGELSLLSKSFVSMAENLRAREDDVRVLMEEQKKTIRLEGELAVTKGIQENFLPQEELPPSSGLDVAVRYSPAEECGGDWYGYFFDPKSGETVCAIADVSGHGAGAAMFTAIIAAVFEEVRQQSAGHFSLQELAFRLNGIINKLGRGRWHATMFALRYVRGESELEVLNAGHPAPLMIQPQETGLPAEFISMPADMIGLAPELKPSVQKVPFTKGMSLLMFTDGLIEGHPDGKPYRQKRLLSSSKVYANQAARYLVDSVHEDWKNFLDSRSPLDDVCLFAVRYI
jgi:serine phosphatase RsbU (regulator of sigma subunit)